MGDGYHGWAFAEILLLLREFVMHRTGPVLQIFRGLRARELFGAELEFGPFPFEGGKVSIAGRLSQRKGELRLTLAGLAGMELSQLEVFLPAAIDAKDLRAAEISGGRLVTLDADSGALRIEVNAEEIKIRYGL